MLDNVLWLLTGLGFAIIVLTRVRLSTELRHGGHSQAPKELVNAHTVLGTAMLGVWIAYLVTSKPLLGYIAIAIGVPFALVGLGLLTRWLSRGGKHSTDTVSDSWTTGPALSIVAHLGMTIGVAFCAVTVVLGWH